MQSKVFDNTLPLQKCILAENTRQITVRQKRCGPQEMHLLEVRKLPPLYAGHTSTRAIQKCPFKAATRGGGPGRPAPRLPGPRPAPLPRPICS